MRPSGKLPFMLMLLILLRAPAVSSQEAVTFSGIVYDTLSGNMLPFAQISLVNSTIGTVTNDDGRFRLDIPAGIAKDTLLVAYMGYHTCRYVLTGSTQGWLRIALSPSVLQLDEVEVVGLTPEEVLRRVVGKIPDNLGKDSLILTAFIRSQKYVGGKLAEFTEAIIEDMKTGYDLYDRKDEKKRSMDSNIPLLLKGRVISDTSLVNSIGDLGKSAGCLGCNFIHDFMEFYYNTVFDERLFRYYSFKMEEQLKPGGGKLYHIWFEQKKGVKETLWQGELFVDGTDFALLKITQKPSFQAFDQFEKQKYRRSFTIGNRPGWYQEMPLMEWTTTYSERNGRYYLNTIRAENWLTFKNPGLGKTVRFAHKNEVVVTDVTNAPERLRNFRGDKSIGVDQRWDQVVGKADDQFWTGFNYLPIEEKLKEGIAEMKK